MSLFEKMDVYEITFLVSCIIVGCAFITACAIWISKKFDKKVSQLLEKRFGHSVFFVIGCIVLVAFVFMCAGFGLFNPGINY